MDDLTRLVADELPAAVELRHRLHADPRVSGDEEDTAAAVAAAIGVPAQRVAGTGRLLRIGPATGPAVMLRAELDALPLTEQSRLSWASTSDAMHACGHDVHTVVQLGVASVLTAMKPSLHGTVKFIFQPAEEGVPAGETGGASQMMKEGALQNPRPEAIFALHTYAEMGVGDLGYYEGPAMSAADTWEVRITGRQSHGARPELSIDPVVTAAQFVEALQTIRSRTFAGSEPAVVTVGTIHGGTRYNIIPADVTLSGTIRTFRAEASQLAEKRLREILKGVTEAAGATGEVLRYDRGAPATVNNDALTRRVVPSLEKAVGKAHVAKLAPAMPSEDFSYFANDVPGFYYRLGMVKTGTTSGDHHTPTFRADDSSIPIGIKAMSTIVLDYLSGSRQP